MANVADEWLTADEVVAIWKLGSKNTLYGMRSRGRGPRGYKVGRELRFKRRDVEAWVEQGADGGDEAA